MLKTLFVIGVMVAVLIFVVVMLLFGNDIERVYAALVLSVIEVVLLGIVLIAFFVIVFRIIYLLV